MVCEKKVTAILPRTLYTSCRSYEFEHVALGFMIYSCSAQYLWSLTTAVTAVTATAKKQKVFTIYKEAALSSPLDLGYICADFE